MSFAIGLPLAAISWPVFLVSGILGLIPIATIALITGIIGVILIGASLDGNGDPGRAYREETRDWSIKE